MQAYLRKDAIAYYTVDNTVTVIWKLRYNDRSVRIAY
jgi:lambda repressor-like predicted transcriptional regulator